MRKEEGALSLSLSLPLSLPLPPSPSHLPGAWGLGCCVEEVEMSGCELALGTVAIDNTALLVLMED